MSKVTCSNTTDSNNIFLTDTTPKKGSLSKALSKDALTFYRRGNKGPERLKDVLKVTQLLSGRERTKVYY